MFVSVYSVVAHRGRGYARVHVYTPRHQSGEGRLLVSFLFVCRDSIVHLAFCSCGLIFRSPQIVSVMCCIRECPRSLLPYYFLFCVLTDRKLFLPLHKIGILTLKKKKKKNYECETIFLTALVSEVCHVCQLSVLSDTCASRPSQLHCDDFLFPLLA